MPLNFSVVMLLIWISVHFNDMHYIVFNFFLLFQQAVRNLSVHAVSHER